MSKVHIVFGQQGAGKSTYCIGLAERIAGVHLSIDKWMWTLYGADLPTPFDPKSMNPGWIKGRLERCEKQIWTTALQIIESKSPVILDLGFVKAAKRAQFISLSKEQNTATQLHYVTAAHALRRKRVLNRNIEKGTTFSFEVSGGMFDYMDGQFDKPTEIELESAIIIDTNE